MMLFGECIVCLATSAASTLVSGTTGVACAGSIGAIGAIGAGGSDVGPCIVGKALEGAECAAGYNCAEDLVDVGVPAD